MGSFAAQPMIFVTGASRSGTTLVARMLGRHDAVAALPEMQYFGEFCDPRRDPPGLRVDRQTAITTLFARGREGILAARRGRASDPAVRRVIEALPPEAGAAEIFAAAIAAFALRAGRTIPCEQTPRNIYYARSLLDWYPEARIVHVLRDPRSVMASQKYRWRRRSLMNGPQRMSRLQQIRTWVNYHPYTVTQLWNVATRLALQLEGHPRFHLLKFEDLILEPARRMSEVCRFLGLGFEPVMLDVEHVNSSHVSASAAERGLSRGAIESWRGRLSSNEQALVHRRCGPLMGRFGYRCEAARMSVLWPVKGALGYLVHLGGAALINPRRLWIQGASTARDEARHVVPAVSGEAVGP